MGNSQHKNIQKELINLFENEITVDKNLNKISLEKSFFSNHELKGDFQNIFIYKSVPVIQIIDNLLNKISQYLSLFEFDEKLKKNKKIIGDFFHIQQYQNKTSEQIKKEILINIERNFDSTYSFEYFLNHFPDLKMDSLIGYVNVSQNNLYNFELDSEKTIPIELKQFVDSQVNQYFSKLLNILVFASNMSYIFGKEKNAITVHHKNGILPFNYETNENLGKHIIFLIVFVILYIVSNIIMIISVNNMSLKKIKTKMKNKNKKISL